MYILKTKINNALKHIRTYSTSVYSEICKKNRFFMILKVSDPLNKLTKHIFFSLKVSHVVVSTFSQKLVIVIYAHAIFLAKLSKPFRNLPSFIRLSLSMIRKPCLSSLRHLEHNSLNYT